MTALLNRVEKAGFLRLEPIRRTAADCSSF